MASLPQIIETGQRPLTSSRRNKNPFTCAPQPPPPAVLNDAGVPLSQTLFSSRRRAHHTAPNTSPAPTSQSRSIDATEPSEVTAVGGRPAAHERVQPPQKAAKSLTPRKLPPDPPSTTSSSSSAPTKVSHGNMAAHRTAPAASVPSRHFPDRHYYGGIYHVPAPAVQLDRILTAMLARLTATTGSGGIPSSTTGGSHLDGVGGGAEVAAATAPAATSSLATGGHSNGDRSAADEPVASTGRNGGGGGIPPRSWVSLRSAQQMSSCSPIKSGAGGGSVVTWLDPTAIATEQSAQATVALPPSGFGR